MHHTRNEKKMISGNRWRQTRRNNKVIHNINLFAASELLGLRRSHENTDRCRGLAVARGRVIDRVCVRLIDTQDGRNTGRLDVQDSGVHDLTVDLHHHLKLFVFYDTFIIFHSRQDKRHLGSASFIVVGGRKKEVIPAERDHVKCVPPPVELIKEVIVGAVGCVVHLQLTARNLVGSICVLDLSHYRRYLFICGFRDGSALVLGVAHTTGFGALNLMAMYPAPQFMC